MFVEAQIPTISRGIAVETIKKYLSDPKGAVRGAALRMDQENPQLLGHSLIGALGVMQSAGERASLVNFKGGLYYYQCYSEEAARRDIPTILVRRATVRHIAEEDREKLESFHQIEGGTAREQYLRQASGQIETFATALEKTNTDLFACTKGFEIEEQSKESVFILPVSTLVQGGIFIVHNALSYELGSNQDYSLDEQGTGQVLGQPFLPTASGSSVRLSLVEIILDKKEFTEGSLGYLRQYSPDWANALDKANYLTPFTKVEYELFLSLVVGVYSRELNQRGLPFFSVSSSTIEGALGILIENGEVIEAPEPKLRVERAYETLNEMEAENLPLYRAYTNLALGRGLFGHFNFLLQAALFGTTDAYALIKTQREAEYWEEKAKP